MSEIADKLREARALIERGWTQDQFARDYDGHPVSGQSRTAVCWCSMGAIAVADPDNKYALYGILSKAIGYEMVGVWNDAPERTQADVLAAFDKAIELAEQSA